MGKRPSHLPIDNYGKYRQVTAEQIDAVASVVIDLEVYAGASFLFEH